MPDLACGMASSAARSLRRMLGEFLTASIFLGVAGAAAQEAEPRSYSNAPVGMNFLIAGYAYTHGGIAFDPSLPVDNEHLRTDSAVLAYARAFDLAGMSAKFDAIVPYMRLSGSADYHGQP